MITVEEARKMSESVESEEIEKLKNILKSTIEKAARRGYRSCSFTSDVSLSKLQEVLPGFAIVYNKGSGDHPCHYEPPYFTISW